ncbi:hypothetical protein LOZ80_38020 [Paenibacillus sp. HWE-109]|uniref:hypothetical protein n=1 Tax=Paenibacillus sp. HWE-109 TaxID=1306526 RepID=UPI001EDE1EE8|nr:hypothetical protein [Paenibacillus sp. HWE-109]UKS27190.1 hypothetical protein LOZ80_38020 [Paenibacillus sp. HWE-109]
MATYQIFVNGKNQGTIETDNAESFVKENYPKATAKINEEEAHIYLSISILDAMNIG